MSDKITSQIFHHEWQKLFLENDFCEDKWVTLYRRETIKPVPGVDNIEHYTALWTYLASPEVCAESIKNYYPDLDFDQRSAFYGDNRFDTYVKDGYESLITVMSFDEIRPRKRQIRIHEDIIHLFHLYEECQTSEIRNYIKYNCGEPEIVIAISDNEVKIKHQYLCDFLAAKKMNLVCVIRSEINLPPTLSSYIDCDYRYTGHEGETTNTNTSISNFSVAVTGGIELQSWFIGKKIIPFKEFGSFESSFDSKYAEFIIGYDTSTCQDIKCLCSDETHKYTRVFFKRAVLEKYRDDVNIKIDSYRVSSPYFSLKCDLDNVEYIWAYCKDIRCLPYTEQLHWAQYSFFEGSLKPSRFHISSQTCWNAQPSSPDLVFKEYYTKLNEVWETHFGWLLFKPTTNLQSNSIDRVFILGDNEPGHFIKHLLPLNLLLVESINAEDIKKQNFELPKGVNKDLGSVMRLNYFLESLNLTMTPFINFCLQLQTLRSEFSEAHRNKSVKTDNLNKALDFIELSFDRNNYQHASITLFSKANKALLWLIGEVSKM